MPEVLSPAQRRTLPAREAFERKFPSPEAKSEHFRAMAERANAGRVVLSGNEATALRDAYRLPRTIADRLPDHSESAT
jgi:hypothetical protein